MQAFREIWTSLLSWKIWLHTGIDDVIGRYRRTVLGPLWIVISQCAFIFGLYLIRKSVLGPESSNYLLFLAISIPTWNLIASFLIDGTSSLMRSKGYIESYPLPLPIFIIRTVVASIVNFAHLLVVYIFISIIFRVAPTISAIWFFPGLTVVIVFGFGVCLGLSALGVRFRDLGPAIASVVGLMFVLTPVFWIPEKAQLDTPLVKYNPFYYLLEIVREPLLHGTVSVHIWSVAILISLTSLFVGAVIYKMSRPTVVYWL